MISLAALLIGTHLVAAGIGMWIGAFMMAWKKDGETQQRRREDANRARWP
jgi:hypothetical protein